MFNLSYKSKQIIFTMLILSIISLSIGYFLINDFYAYFLGIVASTIFSILKLALLEKSLQKAMDMDPKRASSYVNLHYVIRQTLTAIFLFVCIKRPDISNLGAVIGLLLTKPSIYISSLILRKFED